jgi:hypothetical protein
MFEALRGALSLTVSGFGYASHDIGGFEVRVSSFLPPMILTFMSCILVGPSPTRNIPTMGRIWPFLLALPAARLVLLPRSLELR